MCFNKFLECTDDLLRSTEIEAKKHENKAFLKEGETPQQNKRRSFAKIGAIDRPKQQKLKFSRAVAGRSPKSSRTIARVKIAKKTPSGERSPNRGD